MDKPATPLPPGLVPLEPGEDASALLGEEGEKGKEEDVIQEGSLKGSSPGGGEDEEDLDNTLLPAETPSRAWASPEDPEKFQMNFSDEERNAESGAIIVPVTKVGSSDEEEGATEKKFNSPFINPNSTAQDHKKRFLIQTTPKRPLSSPLKRFNRVAPNPSSGSTKTTTAIPLQSSSASLLDASTATKSSQDLNCPGSAPNRKEVQVSSPETTVTMVTVQSRSKDPEINHAASPVPLYSKVVKSSDKGPRLSSSLDDLATLSPIGSIALPERSSLADHAPQKQATLEKKNLPELIAAMPKLDCYEPTEEVDTSMVISNPATVQKPSNEIALSESHDPHTIVASDPTYETVRSSTIEESFDQADMPAFDTAVYKNLKKHDDTGNVQLVSMRGLSDTPGSSPMAFPQGASQNMHPIHYAAANGDKKALSELLSALPISQDPVEMVLGTEKMCRREGVDLMRDSEGRTALMHAVHNGHVQCVKLLAEAGADLNTTTNDGSTCLHEAAYTGSIEMLALLLSLGSDGMMRDKEGRTPLHWCTNNSDPKSIDLLLDKVPGLDANTTDGARMTPLMWAAFHGKPDIIKKLIERGADPAHSDVDGMKAIHWSVQRHDTRALQVLINSDSSQYTDLKGKTVMHQAAEQGCAKAVSLIKAVRPTSVNDLDANARTPLHWGTVCENPEVIRALLTNGADASIVDSSGRTALDYATERGMHYCGLLLSKGSTDETDAGYVSFLTYGTTSATVGVRALQQQSGQAVDPEELKKALTSEQILQIQTVCTGSWINKFTNDGKGPLHPRFFRVKTNELKICWSKSKDASGKDVRSEILVGVRSSASPAVFGRKDFDPLNRHKYAFTIFTASRVLDVVALSSEDFKLWLNGLQLLLHLGSVTATQLLAIIREHTSNTTKTS